MTTQTFSILADSISTFAGFIPKENECFYPHEGIDVTMVEHTWWSLLQQRTGLKLLVNESYSGSRISRTGIRPVSSSFLDEKRQNRLKGDIIIVFGGTNDWGQVEQPTTIDIFRESYETLVRGMCQRHTQSTLYFCTPLQRTDKTLTEKNIHQWSQLDLAQIIRRTVENYHDARLIDLARYPIKQEEGLLADGLHPTHKGMDLLATLMQKGLGL
ncbi:MAG: SGNH/GDSL hydrolase family protein [Sphaerochaetaceae bacterium]